MSISKLYLAAAILLAGTAAHAQDAEKGEKVFKKCKACHRIGEEAKNSTGPVLTGVVGRQAGTYEGYKYGKSMTAAGEAGLTWDEETLNEYLVHPTKFLRAFLDSPKAKGKMSFKLKKEDQRLDVIAYLATFSPVEEIAPEEQPIEEQSMIEDAGTLETAANTLCVRNASPLAHLFAVDLLDDSRKVQILEPGEVLCSKAAMEEATGHVSVFENAEELEGCTRVVPVGHTEDLLKYVDFDRCFWSSNT